MSYYRILSIYLFLCSIFLFCSLILSAPDIDPSAIGKNSLPVYNDAGIAALGAQRQAEQAYKAAAEANLQQKKYNADLKNGLEPVAPPTLSPLSPNSLSSVGFIHAFIASISMIIVSEFGDKTFFIAAIMAMRNNRIEVFASAMAALALMTVLSAAMGFTLPNLLPPSLTHALATLLFIYFGIKLLYDAYGMENGGDLKEELAEVEEELEKKDLENSAIEMESAGLGGVVGSVGSAPLSPSAANTGYMRYLSKISSRLYTFTRRFFSPIFIQCFTMTFLAEWGDRSQIATIALAAAKDPYGVTIGGIIGHSLCTGVAVLGGKLLATRISERTISIMGGVLFLIFAIHSIFFPQ